MKPFVEAASNLAGLNEGASMETWDEDVDGFADYFNEMMVSEATVESKAHLYDDHVSAISRLKMDMDERLQAKNCIQDALEAGVSPN